VDELENRGAEGSTRDREGAINTKEEEEGEGEGEDDEEKAEEESEDEKNDS
jgi:hypothetical protein